MDKEGIKVLAAIIAAGITSRVADSTMPEYIATSSIAIAKEIDRLVDADPVIPA